jgi:hypothetical protein
VEPTRNNLHRGFRSRSQWASGPKLAAHTAGSPGVELPIGPDEAGGVCELPAAGAAVQVVDGMAVGVVGVPVFRREEENALALPVCGCDKAGDNGGGIFGGAAAARKR